MPNFTMMFIALIFVLSASLKAATPANPNASPQARALLNYIYEMYGKKTLSGQMWAPWGVDEISTVYSYTGKYPAIRGQDLMHENANANEIRLAREWWNAGGIPTIMWHWGAPTKGEGYDQSKMSIDISRCFQVGTAEYTAMWADLKRIADHLTVLRDANIPIIWRPMHEMDGGWFWYGMGTGAQFIQLWRTMYNYFTIDRGLNNLIWVIGTSGSPKQGWNPGKEYYDLVGPDSYGTGVQATMYNSIKSIYGSGTPIPYHECGTIPDPAQSFSQGITWSWWMIWHTGHLTNHNRTALIAAYNHDLIITRDEVPNIMNYLSSSSGGTSSSAVSSSSATVCVPSTVDPFYKLQSGTWIEGASITATEGDSLRLGPHPVSGGSWIWTGPANLSSSAREILISPIQERHEGSYVARYTNAAGCTSSVSISLIVNAAQPVAIFNGIVTGNKSQWTLKESGLVSVEVINLQGKLLERQEIYLNKGVHTVTDVGNLLNSQGVRWVRIIQNGRIIHWQRIAVMMN